MTGLGDSRSVRNYEEYLVPLRGKDQQVFTLAIARDITERKQAEQLLQASEEKLRTLFNTMSEGIALNAAVYDEKGEIIDYRILDVNEAFYKVADYTAGQVIGNVATKLYGMSSDFIKSFWEAHKTDTGVIHTEMFSPLNNKTYYISTSPLQNDRFVTSFVDITERKRTEEALKQSEQKFRALTEKSFVGIYVIQDAKMAYVNPSFALMFGYSPEEIIGKLSPKDLIHPDDIHAVMRRL